MVFDPKAAEVISFFIKDSIKILGLLFVMIAVLGFLRTCFSADQIHRWLISQKGWGNFWAAILGAVTPFCSCSSIPFFLSFLKAGIPPGVAFSFLIASPLIDQYLVVMMLGFFGWKITVVYVLGGLLLGIVGGLILGRIGLEKYIVGDMMACHADLEEEKHDLTLLSRARAGIDEAVDAVAKVWGWVLVGVGVGAVIHGYVPQNFIESLLGKTGIFSVPFAALLGVPVYGTCVAIIPIAGVIFQQGIPLGTTMAFMMAVAALSLPEAIMLRRALRLKLLLIFFALTTLGIILIGYLLNWAQPLLLS